MMQTFLQHSNDLFICLAKDFTIIELSTTAKKFYNWQENVYGKSFLALCELSNYTPQIDKNFFDNPHTLNVNLFTQDYKNKQCHINWVIYPTLLENECIGVILIGKDNRLTSTDIAYHLNEIINCIPGCLYWKDHNGYYLGGNKLTAKLAGLNSVQEIIGKTDKELWGNQAEWLIENDKLVMTSGRTSIVEEKLQAADGRWLHFTGVKMPLKDEHNNVIGIIGNSLDITELKTTQLELKKAKEAAEALSKAKSEFIANMSHDVKTPLTGIIGLSEILLHSLRGNELDLVETIASSGHQLLNFFENCIDIAKSEEAELILAKEHFNLKHLLKQIMALFQSAAKAKNLVFSFYYDSDIPESLLGSRVGVYRVLLNLIGNAIKFTQKGSVSIRIKLSKKSTKKLAIIRLNIEDTGIGIPQDKQKIIFENFTRLIPAYKGIYEGSGIGLYLVDKFLKAMGGEIYVHSEQGKGSRFVVVLPFQLSLLDEEEYNEDVLHTSIKQSAVNEKIISIDNSYKKINASKKVLSRVLLVEDSLIAQKAAKLMLKFFSHQVDVAENGKEAIKLFKAGKYDLILMDIGLPDISGQEVTKILRNIEKETSYHVPIIALTAHIDEANRVACLISNMEDVFNKPLSKEAMNLIIDRYILVKKMTRHE